MMTRNEKSLQALFNSNEPGWCFIFGTDKASVFEKNGRYMVEYSYGNQVSDPEYFDDEETAKEYAIDLSQSHRPIKSSENESEYYYNGWDSFLQGVPRENGPKDTDWWNKMSWLRGWDNCSKECDWWDKNYPIKEEQLTNSRRPIKSSVFTEGYDAYFDRLEESDNPYFESANPIEHQEWERGWKVAEEDYMSELFGAQEEDFEITNSRRPIKSGYDENEISNLISKYTNELKSCITGEEVQKVVHDFYYDENVSKYVASIRTRSGKPINSFFTTNNPLEIEYTTDWDVGVRKCKVQNLYKLIRFELNIPHAYR